MMFRKFEIFVANKFIRSRKYGRKTRPVVRISVAAITLSCAVMIITAAVVRGFKDEISQKVIGFGSHIQVSHYESRNAYETKPILFSEDLISKIKVENVSHVQAYVNKAGILKNDGNIQANILKGVDDNFNPEFLQKHLVAGEVRADIKKNEIIISKKTADLLGAEINDKILLYFIQDPPRMRKLKVIGIYESGFAQFDELMSVCNMSLLQKLNDWDSNLVSGYEVSLNDFSRLDETNDLVYSSIPSNLNSMTILDKFPDIFNWLELQNVNYFIIIILMILVAAINAISSLIILILEKTNSIGILRALGSSKNAVRRIFILQGWYLILSGLLLGNIFGIGLCWLQSEFQLIKLPVESYYLPAVPVDLSWKDSLMINGGTILLCFISLVLPSQIISRINMVKVIKFE